MTKIYIYCLFEGERFAGVYSSLKSVHRDALKLCNRGTSPVYFVDEVRVEKPSLTRLRNFFRGHCDIKVDYRSDTHFVSIYKTKLKE